MPILTHPLLFYTAFLSILQAKYLLLYVANEKETGNIRKIVKTRHDVWTKKRLLDEGYPDAGHPSYYMMRIRNENGTDESLRYRVFDLKNVPAIVWGKPNWPFFFVRLRDLQGTK